MTFFDTLFPSSVVASTTFLLIISFLSSLRQNKVEIPNEFKFVILFAQLDFVVIAGISLSFILLENGTDYLPPNELLEILTVMFIVGLACIPYLTYKLIRKVID